MTTRVGRTELSSAVQPQGITTGSAYSAYAAVGSAFVWQQMGGNNGGVIAQVSVLDQGTANAPLRAHFFKTAFSASKDGSPWTLATADFPNYLGYVDIPSANWQSAGVAGGLTGMLAVVKTENAGLHSKDGSRQVWAQLQTPGTPTWGNQTNPLWINAVVLED